MALRRIAARQGNQVGFTPIVQLAIPLGLGWSCNTPTNPSSTYRRLVRDTVRYDVSRAAATWEALQPPRGTSLLTAYRIPPAMATAGRYHPICVAASRRPHPCSMGVGPSQFAFPYPSSPLSTPGPIASVESGLAMVVSTSDVICCKGDTTI